MSRVLLLNPPGSQNYIRDYFCSKLSKAYYQSPPATLLMLSGLLAEKHTVEVQDAIVEELSVATSLQRAREFAPDAVVMLVGAASWDEDRAYATRLKAATGATLIAIGDLLLEDTEARLDEAPALDAALLNFVTPDVLLLIPAPTPEPVPNAVIRRADGKYRHGGWSQVRGDFSLPRPRHELFPLRRYRFPFSVAAPMSVVLTDYGCPYPCTFCVIPTLGFALRPVTDVLEELAHLRRLGVREIFFIDQTFGVRRERTLELCRAMTAQRFGFRWSCFSRADVATPEVLAAMAEAGCHTIIFGVESGNEETLLRARKLLTLNQIEQGLVACQRAGIRTAGTFILGLPGETREQVQKTIAWSLRLPLDFASFNVAVPRAATLLRAEALRAGLISRATQIMDQSGLAGAMRTQQLSAQEVLDLRREALRRFYLRPGYLLRRLLGLRSWRDFFTQAVDGWSVLAEALARRKA